MTVLNCVADVTGYDSKADYWDSFYLKANSVNMPEIQGPSQFAAFTLTEIQLLNITYLYEFAAGNGRDSIFFAECNINVIATDKSDNAVSLIQRKNTNKFLKAEVHDIVHNSYSRQVFNCRTNIAVYARFFVHTLSENELFLFFRNLALMCLGGDRVFLE